MVSRVSEHVVSLDEDDPIETLPPESSASMRRLIEDAPLRNGRHAARGPRDCHIRATYSMRELEAEPPDPRITAAAY
jgi:hypothetical protein